MKGQRLQDALRNKGIPFGCKAATTAEENDMPAMPESRKKNERSFYSLRGMVVDSRERDMASRRVRRGVGPGR